MLLSILIPAYNVADCIEYCLKSILDPAIDTEQYEVIIVDDGSLDDTYLIAEKYAQQYPNIRLFHQVNQGVSVARNMAIGQAQGKYIVFVDPDDAIRPDSLSRILKLIAEHRVEEVTILTSFLPQGKEYYAWRHLFEEDKSYTPLAVINHGWVRGSVCGCLFERRFLVEQAILFPVGVRNCEDTIFLFYAIYRAQRLRFFSIDYYQVVGRPNSAQRVMTLDRFQSAANSLVYVDNLIQQCAAHPTAQQPFLQYLRYALVSNIVDASLSSPHCNLKELKKLGINQYAKVDATGLIYQRNKIRLLNLSFSLYYFLCWIKRRTL